MNIHWQQGAKVKIPTRYNEGKLWNNMDNMIKRISVVLQHVTKPDTTVYKKLSLVIIWGWSKYKYSVFTVFCVLKVNDYYSVNFNQRLKPVVKEDSKF